MPNTWFEDEASQAIQSSIANKKALLVHVKSGQNTDWCKSILDKEALEHLLTKTVNLSLTPSSENFYYFTQLFPVDKLPAIVIIREGKSVLHVDTESTIEDVSNLVSQALKLSDTQQTSKQTEPSKKETQNTDPVDVHDTGSGTALDQSVSQHAETSQGNELSQQHELDCASTSSDAEKESGGSSSNSHISESSTTNSSQSNPSARSNTNTPRPTTNSDKLVKNAKQNRQVQREACLKAVREREDEKRRLSRLLENDRQERKSQEKWLNKESVTPSPTPAGPSAPLSGDHCAVLVRLADGESFRKRFDRDDSLELVRKWVGELLPDKNNGDYLFVQVMPKRLFTREDEQLSFAKLGLCPSVSLVLKYNKNSSDPKARTSITPMISTWLEYGSMALSTLLGLNYAPPPPAGPPSYVNPEREFDLRQAKSESLRKSTRKPSGAKPATAVAEAAIGRMGHPSSTSEKLPDSKNSHSSSNIRTLSTQTDPEEHTSYNGNRLTLEENEDDRK